jgi:FAD dependent oxidoreductase TIGR03364
VTATGHFDDAIAGAGIVGLAHAFHLARRGRRVIVFERSPRAAGASVRNFGMLWPIGQPTGPLRRLALRSREIWLEVLGAARLWHEQAGSLHLAYQDDEAQVLAEWLSGAGEGGCRLLTPAEVLEKSPAVRPAGLRAALWSPTEVCVDPREVIAGLPGWLAAERGVAFRFGCAVAAYDRPHLLAGGGQWQAERLWVCAGADLQTLYPAALRDLGLVPCQLQMMRSQPCRETYRLGPMLAGGLTLTHYRAFASCPTLPALRRRFAAELPAHVRYGIHVMAAQNGRGEIVLGDSHEYGDAIEPFAKQEIDDLILGYLQTFLACPGLRIAARWQGTYVKHPTEPYRAACPAPGVTVVTGVGGAGMTLAFGLAEQVVRETLGERGDAN